METKPSDRTAQAELLVKRALTEAEGGEAGGPQPDASTRQAALDGVEGMEDGVRLPVAAVGRVRGGGWSLGRLIKVNPDGSLEVYVNRAERVVRIPAEKAHLVQTKPADAL